MKLTSRHQVECTREKIRLLQQSYEDAKLAKMGTPQLKDLTLFSLRRTINEMKEDISRFECDVKAGRIKGEGVGAGAK